VRRRRIVALAGGIGGARLVDGLAAALEPEELTVVVNTGDDFEHLGLWISPDVDTVIYTLAGLADRARGWGLAGETFQALEGVAALGGPSWFQLGDRDLGTHLVRTERRRRGERLTAITASIASSLGVRHRILPMSDAPRPTKLEARDGRVLDFQDWLIGERAAPAVRRVLYEGAPDATPEVEAAIEGADLVVLAPSNPYVSIGPILALRGVRERVEAKPTVAVSPIVQGRAVKGPLATMLRDVSALEPSAASVLEHYAGLVDAFVVERGDEAGLGVPALATATIMGDREDRARLAREVLAFAERAFS
jgi:LPPG:FO 2-phospho-L-lactate transferase